MTGDIALAGFLLTAEEWRQLDPDSRAQLLAAVLRRDEPWVASAPVVVVAPAPAPEPAFAAGSGPHRGGTDQDP